MVTNDLSDKVSNFQVIFEFNPIAMIMLDDQTQVVNVNDAALSMFGSKKENVLDKRFGDAFGCLDSTTEDRGCGFGLRCQFCELQMAADLAAQTGQSSTNLEIRKEFSNGDHAEELWFRASITPIILSGRRHVVVALADITDTKKKEIALVNSRDYYLKLLDDFPTLMALV